MAKNKIDSPLSQSVGDDPKKAPDKWETEDHMRTLIKAHEIINNPVHLKAVHKLAGRHRKAVGAITSLQQVRDISNAKSLAKGKAQQGLDPLVDDDDGDEGAGKS